MLIRTPTDLGAAIRDQRQQRGLDQHELAQAIGVSRQWVNAVEKGKPRAEVGLILRALEALGIALSIEPEAPAGTEAAGLDIDRIVDQARRTDDD